MVLSGGVAASPSESQLLPCQDPLGCLEFPSGSDVLVGGLYDFSTHLTMTGREQADAAALAVSQFGDLLGLTIEFRPLNTGCDPETSRRLLRELTGSANLLGVVGPTCNDTAAELILQASKAGTVLVSPSISHPSYTTPAFQYGGFWQPGFHTLGPSDAHQAIAMARFAYWDLGLRKLAIGEDGTQDSAYLADSMAQAFKLQGGAVSARRKVSNSDDDWGRTIAELATSGADALYLPVSRLHALRILDHLQRGSVHLNVPVLGSSDWVERDVTIAASNSGLTLYAATHYPRSYAVAAFMLLWMRNYSSGFHTAAAFQGYDAMALLLQAALTAAERDSQGNVSIGRLALKQALAGTDGFPGVSGNLTCSAYGDCAANDGWSFVQFITRPGQGRVWPPLYLQHAGPPHPVQARYLGRSLNSGEIRAGPDSGFPLTGVLQPESIYQISQSTLDRNWYNLQHGGWVPAENIALHELGLPAAVNVPELNDAGSQEIVRVVGNADWPVPYRIAHAFDDGLSISLSLYMREGDRDYARSVPAGQGISRSCPYCGHIGMRVSMKFDGRGERTVSIHDFQLSLIRDAPNLPQSIPAAKTLCRTNRFRNDEVVMRSGVGTFEKDLCFFVQDTTRAPWFYSLTYAPATDDGSVDTQPTVYFSLQ